MLDALVEHDECQIYLGSFVLEEVTASKFQKQKLEQIPRRWRTISADAINGDLFLSILNQYSLGKGETECITIALQREEFVVAIDDRKARKITKNLIGEERITGSIGLLRMLTSEGSITPEYAFERYQYMKEVGGFLPDLGSDYFEPPF